MTVFEAVKDSLSITQVARDYGIRFRGRTKAYCPFHDDHHPSMSFWGDEKKFTCFSGSCGLHGDVIDLVGRLDNLLPLEAAQALNDRYHLNIKFDEPVDWDVISSKQQQREILSQRRLALEDWLQNAYCTMVEYEETLNGWKKLYVPLHPALPISNRYTEAITSLDFVSYVLHHLEECRGDYQKMVEFYMSQHRYIENVERQLLKENSTHAVRPEKNTDTVTGHRAIVLPIAGTARDAL